jgi:DNA-binding transcriptional LysR family regulator
LPLVLYPPGCAYRTRALTALESAGIPWRIAIETPDWQSIRTATEMGLGITLLDNMNGMENVCALDPHKDLPVVDPVYLTLRVHPSGQDDTHIHAVTETLADLITAV